MAAELRRSRDAPIPDFLLRLFGRSPDVRFVCVLRTRAGLLPLSTDPRDPKLEMDPYGEMSGQVILFSDGAGFGGTFAELERHIQLIRDARRSSQQIADDIDESDARMAQLWDRLTRTFFSNPATAPAFARCTLTVSRTGECHVAVSDDDIFTSREARRSHWMRRMSPATPSAVLPDWQRLATIVARHSFFFLRDLTHRHYHHNPHSDMATMVYPWSANDDATWRSETQYGLVRMAISSRRADEATRYKQSLGVIAYAECFQRTLAGWVRQGNQKTATRPLFYEYDFASLRGSIEAILRVSDFNASQRVQIIAVSVAALFAGLALIVASGQIVLGDVGGVKIEDLPQPAQFFWSVANLTVRYPWHVLLLGAAILQVYFASFQTLLRRTTIPQTLFSGLFRAVVAVMGSVASTATGAFLSWVSSGILALLGFGAALYVAYRLMIEAIRFLG